MNPLLLKGLNARIPIIIPIEGGGLLIRGLRYTYLYGNSSGARICVMLRENSGAVAIGGCKDANPISLPSEVITLGGHHLRYTVQFQMCIAHLGAKSPHKSLCVSEAPWDMRFAPLLVKSLVEG